MTRTSHPFDVFVSYRWVNPDQDWVRDSLVPALRNAGLKICLDVEDFVPGRDLILEMSRAGQESRHALCILSPDYFSANRMVGFESLMARRSDPSGNESRLIPLIYRRVEIPEWLRGLIPVDWTEPKDRAREWRKLLKVLLAPTPDAPQPGAPSTVEESHVPTADPIQQVEKSSVLIQQFDVNLVRPESHRPNQTSADIAKVPSGVNRAPIQANPQDLFSRDPVRAFGAAESLIESSAPIAREFLTRLDFWSFVSEMAAERLVTARPELGRTLAEIATDGSLHFSVRITAASAFRPIHKSTALPLINEMYQSSLNGHFDDERIAIESLGRMGEDPGLADLICDGDFGIPKSDYTFEKLNSYVIEALCRVFVNSVEGLWGMPSPYEMEKAWKTVVRRVRNPSSIEGRVVRILSAGKPLHAEVVSDWLENDSQEIQTIAIQVLGQMGIKRLGRKALAFAKRAPSELIHPAYMAVSAIGTTEGLDFLEEQMRASKGPSPADFPLLLTSHIIQDQARVASILALLLDRNVFERFHVWRIAGLRKLESFEMQIVEALGSSDAAERGTAALALSRINSRKYAGTLEVAFKEASHNVERVFTSLAIIKSKSLPSFTAAFDTLRDTLQDYSYGLRSQLKDDIVAVLTECRDPQVSHLGRCWAMVYEKYPLRY